MILLVIITKYIKTLIPEISFQPIVTIKRNTNKFSGRETLLMGKYKKKEY